MSILLPFKKNKEKTSKTSTAQFVAFGGGKGGIGKTFLSSNFAIFLAKKGKRTLIVDLDLGGANTHTYLGVQPSGPNLKDYLNSKVSSLEDVIGSTHISNLYLIKGLDDWSTDSKITHEKIEQLIAGLKNLDFDYIVFDLAAGTHSETIEFFLACNKQVIVTTPEPTSIENCYQFLKKAFHRVIMDTSKELNCVEEITKLLNQKDRFNIKTPAQLVLFLEEKEPELGKVLKKKIQSIMPKIIINQARSHQDQILANSIEKICSQYFSMNCEGVGFINYDSAVWQSLRSLKPFQIEQTKSNTTNELSRVFEKLMEDKNFRIQTGVAL
jgi:flagellar biosynthesis protein FlhG